MQNSECKMQTLPTSTMGSVYVADFTPVAPHRMLSEF